VGGVNWIGLTHVKDNWRDIVNLVKSLWVPENARKLSSGYATSGLSSTAPSPQS
jgi:hypothetical protein